MTRMQTRNRLIRYGLEAAAVVIIAVLASAALALHLTRPEIPYSPEAASVGVTVRARVDAVLDETVSEGSEGLITANQQLELTILSQGPYEGQTVTVPYSGMGPSLSAVRFREGDRALVMVSEVPEISARGEDADPAAAPPDDTPRVVYQVADHVRLTPLALISGLFAVITVAIGRWQGARAIFGLLLSGLLVGGFILPQILAHRDPVLVTLIGSGLLLAVTLYLIQGWNVAGHTALLGMMVSLLVTGGLAVLSSSLADLTGFGSEETLFIQSAGVEIEMRGLLLAGMIIGTAGVLDDVVIAQAVAVLELHAADATLKAGELYRRAMRIGITHLTSMVNTLVLAYASTALPLMILFYLYPEPWYLTVNRELMAEEIVRAMVGSIGLMLAVPLTTVVAARVAPEMQLKAQPAAAHPLMEAE